MLGIANTSRGNGVFPKGTAPLAWRHLKKIWMECGGDIPHIHVLIWIWNDMELRCLD
jgi:hypothetical protein